MGDAENIAERLVSPAAKLYEYRLDHGAFLREAHDEIVRLRADLAEAGDVPPMSAYYRG